jgi:hypothetical protein
MSEQAIEFVENWVSENITAADYQAGGDTTRAQSLAAQCLAAARAAGVLDTDMADAFDDLPAFMAGQMQEAHDRENPTADAPLPPDDDDDEPDDDAPAA